MFLTRRCLTILNAPVRTSPTAQRWWWTQIWPLRMLLGLFWKNLIGNKNSVLLKFQIQNHSDSCWLMNWVIAQHFLTLQSELFQFIGIFLELGVFSKPFLGPETCLTCQSEQTGAELRTSNYFVFNLYQSVPDCELPYFKSKRHHSHGCLGLGLVWVQKQVIPMCKHDKIE